MPLAPLLSAEVDDYLTRTLDALDRGVASAVSRLGSPRCGHAALTPRALERAVALLAGCAIGLVAGSVCAALARHADRATAEALRAELADIAARPELVAAPRRGLDHELAPKAALTTRDLRELLCERLGLARAALRAYIARLVAVAIARAPEGRAGFAAALGGASADDLVPYRFGERVEASWRELTGERASVRPVAMPAAREPTENYCWMRIR